MYKLDSAYQFWNTTANAEKQLLQWLGEIASDDKKSVPSNTIETEQVSYASVMRMCCYLSAVRCFMKLLLNF
jgi:uncharacterized Rmd1/YagE family protein